MSPFNIPDSPADATVHALKLTTFCRVICVLPSFDRYMKYLYPYECEKRQLSTPEELQVAIEGNRREGRRSSYGTYSEMVQRSPLPNLPPTHPSQMSPLSLVTSGRPAMNGNSNHHHHHPSHPQPHGQPLGAGMQHSTLPKRTCEVSHWNCLVDFPSNSRPFVFLTFWCSQHISDSFFLRSIIKSD